MFLVRLRLLKGSVVNRALPFLRGRTFDSKFTDPLMLKENL